MLWEPVETFEQGKDEIITYNVLYSDYRLALDPAYIIKHPHGTDPLLQILGWWLEVRFF